MVEVDDAFALFAVSLIGKLGQIGAGLLKAVSSGVVGNALFDEILVLGGVLVQLYIVLNDVEQVALLARVQGKCQGRCGGQCDICFVHCGFVLGLCQRFCGFSNAFNIG